MLRVVEHVRVVNHFDLPSLPANLGDRLLNCHLRRNPHITRMHQSCGFIFGIQGRSAAFAAALRDHRYLEIASLVKQLVGEVQPAKPSSWRLAGWPDTNL